MRRLTVAPADAEGMILAETLALATRALHKGTRISEPEISGLVMAGITSIVAMQLEPGDVREDEAAFRAAQAVHVPGLRCGEAVTGRVDILADSDGLLAVDSFAVARLNEIDPALTLATLPDTTVLRAGEPAAAVKIIPFAVDAVLLERWEEQAVIMPPLHVSLFRPFRAVLLQTFMPDTKPGLLDKASSVTAERLARFGGALAGEQRLPHTEEALVQALLQVEGDAQLILVAVSSAAQHAEDTLPAALIAAGGAVERIGMPVDPGHLLLLGSLSGRTVLGLPGCARSPAPNGIDLVLARFAARVRLNREALARMGTGGLLRR